MSTIGGYHGLGPTFPVGGNQPTTGPTTSNNPQDTISGSGSGLAEVGHSFVLALREGRITIAEFAKLVQTALDKAKEGSKDAAVKDAELNKLFSFAILDEFKEMQKKKAAIADIGKQAESIYENARSQESTMGTSMKNIYKRQADDEKAANKYNQALANYNDQNSPDYHNKAKFDKAQAKYNSYVKAREKEINQFDASVDRYNTNASSTNKALKKLNDDLEGASFVAKSQKMQGQEPEHIQHFQGSRLQAATGFNSVSGINYGSYTEISAAKAFDMEEFMKTYWGPVESLFLKQMIDLVKTLDFHLNIQTFQKMRGTLKSAEPQSMLMLNLANALQTKSLNGNGGALGSSFQQSFVNRLAAKAIMADIASQVGVSLPQSVQTEIEHAVVAALSKASLFGSSSDALSFLGDQFAKLNMPDAAFSIAMAFAFGGRIGSMVEGDILKSSALHAISGDPALSSLSDGEKTVLADKMVAGMQLGLLNAAVMNMAISLGTPGLVSQVMLNALLNAGIDPIPSGTDVNALLTDRSGSLAASGEVAKFLVDKGYSSDEAAQIVNDAVANAQNKGPYASVQDFISNLGKEFELKGLDSRIANTLSIDYVATVLGNNPTALLGGNDLNQAVMLGLISKDVFLSEGAKSSVLSGVDSKLGSNYEKAVSDLLNSGNPPLTLREARDTLYSNLVAQGTGADSAWKMANNFTDLVKGGEPFAMALEVNPFAVGFLQSQLVLGLSDRGLTGVQASSVATAIINASLGSPSVLKSGDIASSVITALDVANSYRLGILEIGIASDLSARGISNAGAIASVAAASVLGSKATDLTAALRDALVQGGIDPDDAQEYATAILNANVFNKDVSLGVALLSADFTTAVITKALIDEGVDPVLAAKIAASLSSSVADNLFALNKLAEALAKILTAIIVNSVSVDPAVASAIARSINIGSDLNLGRATSDLASGLLAAGFADNLVKAGTLAATLIEGALRVPNALNSDLEFKAALIATAALTLDVDSNVARDLVSKLGLQDIVMKDLVLQQLIAAFQANGYADLATAQSMAAAVAAGLFQFTAGYTPQSAFQDALGNHLMGTLGVPASVALALSRGIDINNILIIGALQTDISTAFVSTRAKELIDLILKDPSAFSSEVALRDSAFNNLFINMGIDHDDARVIASNLALEGIINRESITQSLYDALIDAGYTKVQADIMAIKGAEMFFLINTPRLDLPLAMGIAQTLALSGSFGFKELSNTLFNLLNDRGV